MLRGSASDIVNYYPGTGASPFREASCIRGILDTEPPRVWCILLTLRGWSQQHVPTGDQAEGGDTRAGPRARVSVAVEAICSPAQCPRSGIRLRVAHEPRDSRMSWDLQSPMPCRSRTAPDSRSSGSGHARSTAASSSFSSLSMGWSRSAGATSPTSSSIALIRLITWIEPWP